MMNQLATAADFSELSDILSIISQYLPDYLRRAIDQPAPSTDHCILSALVIKDILHVFGFTSAKVLSASILIKTKRMDNLHDESDIQTVNSHLVTIVNHLIIDLYLKQFFYDASGIEVTEITAPINTTTDITQKKALISFLNTPQADIVYISEPDTLDIELTAGLHRNLRQAAAYFLIKKICASSGAINPYSEAILKDIAIQHI